MTHKKHLLRAAALCLLALCASAAPQQKQLKVLRLPMRASGPGALDPAIGSTVYDNECASLFYETLVQYKYLARPYELEPLLLEEMPQVSADGLRYSFKLKKGIRFHDDPCFAGGKGRELVTDDVFYSWKRLADKEYNYKSYWLFENTIQGLDEYKDEQARRRAAGQDHDYAAAVSGLIKTDDHSFEVVLKQPVQSFLWKLAQFQTSIVCREAVEKYGTEIGRRAVGTGAFVFEEWIDKKSLTAARNPNYHEQLYPSEHQPEDEALGLHLAQGQKLPFADRVEVTMFSLENPMWLEFLSGKLDYTQVPAENYLEAFHKRSRKLKKEFEDKGIVAHAVPLLDFIFRGFNMEDPLLGGYTDKQRWLRQAIHLAVDHEELNDSYYNGTNILYDGMIPPGLAGYPPEGKGPVSWLGSDVERAKELLAKAGYPEGKGLPVIDFYTSVEGNTPEQAEMIKRQVGRVGIQLNLRTLRFADLIAAIDKKAAGFFGFAWSSDYPDGENNLSLFYGPNEAPGANHFNYKNAEYDKLYEKIRVMPPSEERTKIYEQMRDMVLADTPYVGSMARTRFYLVQPWLKNYKPSEQFFNWHKYMDVDEAKRSL